MYLKLAWRNVWRNRRRSLITMSAVIFSVLLITVMRSLQYGSYDAMESQAVQTLTGHLQIQAPGYQEEQTFAYLLDDPGWREAVAGDDWVETTTRRLTGFGLVSGDSASAGAMILGIEPSKELRVSTFMNRVVAGTLLEDASTNEAVLGHLLARNLDVATGDTVVVITQGYRGQMGADVYRVRGLIRTGAAEMDRSIMVITLSDAQFLFSTGEGVTQIVVSGADFRDAPAKAAELQARLPADRFAVLDWNTLMPELRQMIFLDNMGGIIFLFFMLLLVGFELFNTTTMSVMERMREFGILQAIGMQPGSLARVVLVELLLKLGMAVALSALLSGALLWYLHGNPIPLTAELVEMYEEFGFSVESLLFSTRPAVFLEPFVSILVIALLTTIYPVVRVFRLDITAALRRET